MVEARPLGAQIRSGGQSRDSRFFKLFSIPAFAQGRRKLIWFSHRLPGVAFRAILLRWRFVACLPKGLLPAGLFFPGNMNPRLPTQPFPAWVKQQRSAGL